MVGEALADVKLVACFGIKMRKAKNETTIPFSFE
jgi:hypothetical protein